MEKKIVIPEGMLTAAWQAVSSKMKTYIPGNGPGELHVASIAVEAALLWLSENPIVPTKEQLGPVVKECGKLSQSLYGYGGWIWMITEWQRRMLLAPGPDVPEAVSKLEPGKCPHRWQAKIDYITMERVVYCEICCCEFSRSVGGEKEVQ